ncbi:unnamed protein product, partial [Didymodactylos carnosus]
VSDSLPLIVSLPFEIQFFVMYMNYYPFGQIGCKLRSLLAETSTNVSILTISAFTIERFIAICHPLRSSSLSTIHRALKIQLLIWIIAILFAIPYYHLTVRTSSGCTLDLTKTEWLTLCFRISASIFFVLPAFLLFIMYALMARRLYTSGFLQEVRSSKDGTSVPCLDGVQHLQNEYDNHQRSLLGQCPHRESTTSILTRPNSRLSQHRENSMKKSAFKMLFAVVVAFIICYAPFHVQRLITSKIEEKSLTIFKRRCVELFYFVSGILYYLGSTINPIFYHLFSSKYRLACTRTLKRFIHCRKERQQKMSQAEQMNKILHNHREFGRSNARLLYYTTIPPPICNKCITPHVKPDIGPNDYISNQKLLTHSLPNLTEKHHL